jgi:hypothetical protein
MARVETVIVENATVKFSYDKATGKTDGRIFAYDMKGERITENKRVFKKIAAAAVSAIADKVAQLNDYYAALAAAPKVEETNISADEVAKVTKFYRNGQYFD